MKKIHVLLPIVCAVMFSSSAAEDLTKEITVAKDYIPTEQKATKTNTLPVVLKTTVPKKTLSFSDWATAVDVPLDIPVMAPYGYKTKYDFSNKRGYFDFGAGSYANIVGSAGYHFIDKEKMSLKGWLQHTSTWAGKNNTKVFDNLEIDRMKQKFNDNVVGVDFSNRFFAGTLNVDAFYHYDFFNYYGATDESWKGSDREQTVNEFNLQGSWKSKPQTKGFNYFVGLAYNHFGYSHSLHTDLKPIHENHFQLTAGGESYIGSSAYVGVNLAGNYAYYTNPTYYEYSVLNTVEPLSNRGLGIVTINPYFRYREKKVNMLLGVNVDASINDGTILRFSPNVKVDYQLLDGFTVYANAQGGKHLSLLSDMSDLNCYTNPSSIMESVYSPVDAEFGFRVGPFTGFSAKIFGGYGIFKNQQLPWLPVTYTYKDADSNDKFYDYLFSTTFMRGVDTKGFRVGMELSYELNNLLEVATGIQYSPQDNENGYAFGLDRPKCVIDAKLKLRPIEKLTVTLGYQLRAKRAYYSHFIVDTLTPPITNWKSESMDDVNLLNIGASYQINNMFGVFVEGNNLLNKQWDVNYGMSAQKINFLGGVSILF